MDLFVLSASLGLNTTGFENGINKAKNLLKQFGAAVVDFSKDVVETGMNFDKQMSAVQAVMGLTENTEENLRTMNRLREFALEQARDSIFTSEETAKAYYYMGMAGWKAEQMTAGLPGVMALAAASGEDLKLTSDMVTDSLTAFGLGAGQATHFADVLAVTATNSNTDVARMQQTFKNLAPIAGALGYSIEDVALSIGLLANAGVKGSQAGTALRNIFTRIATNAGSTAKDLGALDVITEKLGVSFYTAEGRARPWGEVITDARNAWRQLDPSQMDAVTAAFGEFSAESQSAEEVMDDFTNSLDTWTDEWNNLSTSIERENFVSELEPMFNALGISMRDSNGNLREFSAVARDARVKLGGLTDAEQIYYGKQIGSLRGISGWLALMNASEEDVERLTEAINNADGAAQAMADTRLDNLWGDVVRFNSALDVMKVALYDDVKGPLREIVQGGVESINRITDAIEKDGLIGGIEQLGVEIENIGETLAPILESLGKAIVPVITSVITEIAPALAPVLLELGVSLGKGILDGIANDPRAAGLIAAISATGIGKGFLQMFGVGSASKIPGAATVLGSTFGKGVRFVGGLARTFLGAGGAGALAGLAAGGIAYEISDARYRERMFGEGKRTAERSDEILEAAEGADENILRMFDELTSMFDPDRFDNEGYTSKYLTTEDYDTYGRDYLDAIENLGWINDNLESLHALLGEDLSQYGLDENWLNAEHDKVWLSQNYDNVTSAASNILAAIGEKLESGEGFGIGDSIAKAGEEGATAMQSSLETSGDAAAQYIASSIQSQLNNLTLPLLSTGVSLSLAGLFSGMLGHATAVSSGEFLHGMTPFGVDRRGVLHYGGETQDEVVVGVNSLNHMIQKSVQSAVSKVNPAQQPITVQLVLDSGELLGAVDIGLNNRAAWKGGGRAL